jgi:hypothetical protein
VADGKPEAGRCAVVEDVHCKPIEADDVGQPLDHAGDIVERVTELISCWHIGLAESREVRRDDMKPVGE